MTGRIRRFGFGSSPLTRGAPTMQVKRRVRAGLIPAHAGSTGRRWRSSSRRPAHPRSRGEHAGVPLELSAYGGSSPLTRGARVYDGRYAPRRGLIPAHAGSTIVQTKSDWRAQAHPRSRGEHIQRSRPRNRDEGSSPLTRGAHSERRGRAAITRLIPAHAGSTFRALALWPTCGAHPRSRGEHERLQSAMS